MNEAWHVCVLARRIVFLLRRCWLLQNASCVPFAAGFAIRSIFQPPFDLLERLRLCRAARRRSSFCRLSSSPSPSFSHTWCRCNREQIVSILVWAPPSVRNFSTCATASSIRLMDFSKRALAPEDYAHLSTPSAPSLALPSTWLGSMLDRVSSRQPRSFFNILSLVRVTADLAFLLLLRLRPRSMFRLVISCMPRRVCRDHPLPGRRGLRHPRLLHSLSADGVPAVGGVPYPRR